MYEHIEHEKAVYRRLGHHAGVVHFFDQSGPGIQLALMEKGDVRNYLAQHCNLAFAVKLCWFLDMAHALIHIHNRHVIVADISTRNLLLLANLSVKFSNFGESSILPLNVDMETACDAGYSILTDIGQFGALMYEIISGQPCEFDLFMDQPLGPATAAWPRRENLPSVENLWLGEIIEICWKKGSPRNSLNLLESLNSIVINRSLALMRSECSLWPVIHQNRERVR